MKDVSGYATRKISPTMEAFADYLIAEVFGGTLPDGIEEVAFRKGVALGGSTRGYFQASERWKNDPRNYLANVEANAEKRAEERAAKAAEALRKANERAAKAVEALEAAKAKAEAKAAEIAARLAEEGSEEGSEEGAPTPETVRRSRRGPLGKLAENEADAA